MEDGFKVGTEGSLATFTIRLYYVDQLAILIDSPDPFSLTEDGNAFHADQYHRRLVRNGNAGYPITQQVLILYGYVARHGLPNC
jgi:hypothetical protein